jgi:hypothetical protein
MYSYFNVIVVVPVTCFFLGGGCLILRKNKSMKFKRKGKFIYKLIIKKTVILTPLVLT